MNKYYFVSTMYRYSDQPFKPQHEVIKDQHPFETIAEYNKSIPHGEVVLLSWQEITKEEYDFYQKLEKEE